MIAKNVGIRRASGKFVATNIDVIINQGYEFISQNKLKEKQFTDVIAIVSIMIIQEIFQQSP